MTSTLARKGVQIFIDTGVSLLGWMTDKYFGWVGGQSGLLVEVWLARSHVVNVTWVCICWLLIGGEPQ